MVGNPFRRRPIIFDVLKNVRGNDHVIHSITLERDRLIENLTNNGHLTKRIETDRVDLRNVDFAEFAYCFYVLADAGP